MLPDFQYMADCSTTTRGIPIQFAGGYSARRHLHAGIWYVPTPSIVMELHSALKQVLRGAIVGTQMYIN